MKYTHHSSFLLYFPALTVLLWMTSTSMLFAQETTDTSRFKLVWFDEFEGRGIPSTTKWERQEYNRRNNNSGPDGWWSNQDSYLDGTGNLVIRVRKIANRNNDADSCDYSVGMVRTKGKFEHLYGRYEIRCKLPAQPGWWVAFWMMQGDVSAVGNGGVDGMEVDIMEGFGWTNLINNAFHWDGYGSDHKSIGKQVRPNGIREGFHTFAMDWTPDNYIFYIDGNETWRSVGGGVCTKKGYIKVTGEISTEDWAINQYWANNPASATYPDSFLVDYVRVYDFKNTTDKTTTGSIGGIRLFPNPTGGSLRISWDSELSFKSTRLDIFNAAGQKVKSISNLKNNFQLDVSDLCSGLYSVSFFAGNELSYLKFIKI